jgi:L-aspartate oxidase
MAMATDFIDTDFLVIGSGLAGHNAAIRLAEVGRVLLVTKRQGGDNATAFAQGGFASVMAAEDSFDLHIKDTLEAGAGLCDEAAVRSIIAAGPQAVARLVELGTHFDKDLHDETAFALTREGGHSARRILHAKDATGREIDRALSLAASSKASITTLPNHIAVDLITRRRLGRGSEDRCLGAYVLDNKTGEVKTVRAKATLLATGGAGKVYLYTSNPDVATGDGVAMAFRAGATVANMEFMQFHPTCLYHPHAKSYLISEALRGEGGVLRTKAGHAFMAEVHPKADLAPRDVVARAIDLEMKRSGDDYVTLDMTRLDPGFVAGRFPNIHSACLALGIDMTKMPIPVVPAAHYLCGGVETDLEGHSSIPGLWAAGETACTGLHGANRLASNSLLEAAVMSERAAAGMVEFAKQHDLEAAVPAWDAAGAVNADEAVVVSHNWDEVRRTMWNYVGIVRSDRRLERAMARIDMLQEEIREYYWDFTLTSDLVELRNLALVAFLIVASAQYRRESRGLHHNLDTPAVASAWQRPTRIAAGAHHNLVIRD